MCINFDLIMNYIILIIEINKYELETIMECMQLKHIL